jgi:hypothetical protein
MPAFSVTEWIARTADRLQEAGLDPSEVVIAISESQENTLRDEVRLSTGLYFQSFHHSEFMGWRVIVKGRN